MITYETLPSYIAEIIGQIPAHQLSKENRDSFIEHYSVEGDMEDLVEKFGPEGLKVMMIKYQAENEVYDLIKRNVTKRFGEETAKLMTLHNVFDEVHNGKAYFQCMVDRKGCYFAEVNPDGSFDLVWEDTV